MATGDGWTSQFIDALAQFLETNAVGAWRPDGTAYAADEIAITDSDIPPTPDRNIAIAAYPVPGDHGMQDHTVGIQFRIRGTTDRRVCNDIGDAIFELLDSKDTYLLADIWIVQSYRQSHVSLGKDANERWEASHNYYFEAMRLTTNRTQ